MRFDTEHGSITFSGDTWKSHNLIDLARGSGLLVHEAISDPADAGLSDAIRDHMLQSHTLVTEIGGIAHEADVPRVILSHVGDFTGEIGAGRWEALAKKGYGGEVSVGEDLSRIRLS